MEFAIKPWTNGTSGLLVTPNGMPNTTNFYGIHSMSVLIRLGMQKKPMEAEFLEFQPMRMKKEGVNESIAFVALLKECGKKKNLCKGIELHDEAVKSGLFYENPYVGSSLISMYAKCGDFVKAKQVLEKLPNPNIVSWNALMSGYAMCGEDEELLDCFKKMQSEGVSGDAVTFIYCLKACSNMGALDRALKFHVEIERKGFLEKDVGNTLIYFYAKHGMSAKAQSVFEQLSNPN